MSSKLSDALDALTIGTIPTRKKVVRKVGITSLRDEWWKKRFVCEGQIMSIRGALIRLMNLPEVCEVEKRFLEASLAHLPSSMKELKEGRERSFKKYCERR